MPASRPAAERTAPEPRASPVRGRGAGVGLPRYAGLAATTLMASLSWTVGALPWQRPHQLASWAPLLTGPVWHRVGLGLWPVAVAVLVAAWWRLGQRVRDGRVGVATVLATVALWAAPLLLAAPLASHDAYSYACQGQAYLAGADPYRVGPAALPCRWLEAVPPIWRAQPAPYGPVAVLVSAVAAKGSLIGAVAVLRLAAVAGLVLLAAGLPVLAARCGTDPAAALWLGLANPVVLVHLVGGVHHDALLAGLVVAALALAARGSPVAGAAVVGVAVAVKATAVVVLPFVAVLAFGAGCRWLRSRMAGGAGAARWQRPDMAGRWPGGVGTDRSRWLCVVAVLVAAGAGFTVLTLAAGLDLGWAAALPTSRQPVSWMSPPSAVGAVLGAVAAAPLSLAGVSGAIPTTIEAVRGVALYALLPVVLVVLWWRATRTTVTAAGGTPAGGTPAGGTADSATRAVVTAAGLALAATVALAPVVYPWYAAAPAAVLAAAATGPIRRSTAVVLAVLSFVVGSSSLNLAIVTRWPGAVVEVAALVVLAVMLVRRRGRGAADGA
ncbi:polyprenol phosphomannose-dependent alpha 1,6 mannosyltransferase MptB [Planosporangium sp. 12N6]|uniref:polyprenol phosphomannose-dependent alpha 1,6 mannosyltransferase MptB n=1 Tax=Planosporangium spinosum TaxID=3402278 RepID=UPI003CE7A3F0